MKSEKKLQNIIINLDWMENCQTVTEAQRLAKEIKQTLQEFIIDNSKAPAKSFDLQRYTAKPNTTAATMRPRLTGVCYDTINKCAIATDAHLIIVDRETYDPTIEQRFADQLDANGCISIDKYGNPIEGIYPDYTRVFPTRKVAQSATNYTINIDELTNYIKRAKAYIKVERLSYCSIWYNVGPAYFNAELLLSFAIATEGNISIIQADKAAFWTTDQRQALIMPLLAPESFRDNPQVHGLDQQLLIVNHY